MHLDRQNQHKPYLKNQKDYMLVQLDDTTFNTDNVFSYKYDDTFRAEKDTLLVTSVCGEKFRLSGKRANALYNWLEDRSEAVDVDSFDDGAVEYHGH